MFIVLIIIFKFIILTVGFRFKSSKPEKSIKIFSI